MSFGELLADLADESYEEAVPIVRDILKHTSESEQLRLLRFFESEKLNERGEIREQDPLSEDKDSSGIELTQAARS